MKKLIFRLVFLLTSISYISFYKWWYVQVEDGFDVVMNGFPLINYSPTMASSMEFEYFIFETIVNLFSFIAFWLVIVFIVNRFIKPIAVSNTVGKICLVLCGLYIICLSVFNTQMSTKYYFKREWNIKIMDSGFRWFWQ